VKYLLTLDLASSLGWSCGEPADQSFSYGRHQLPKTGEDIGDFLYHYRGWLHPALDGVDLCVFESPVLPRTTSLATARKLYSQAGMTELVCRDRKIKCMEVNLQSIKTFMGVDRTRGADQKASMVDCVKRYGYEPENDDEADAIAIRLFVLHRMFPAAARNFNLDMGLLGAATA
jgi:hypothetical protein